MSAFVRACEVCDRDLVANPSPRAPLGYMPADQPFAAFYIDIVGSQGSLSLGVSPKSILTMIDGLTGWAEAVPIADQSAPTVAHAVYTEWISSYGVPEQLHSDRGVQFESAVFAELCAVFGIEKTRTTPYRPQANGKCEVQLDAHFDAETHGTKTSIRLGTAAVAGVTGVSIDYFRSDWIHTVSIDYRPRDAHVD